MPGFPASCCHLHVVTPRNHSATSQLLVSKAVAVLVRVSGAPAMGDRMRVPAERAGAVVTIQHLADRRSLCTGMGFNRSLHRRTEDRHFDFFTLPSAASAPLGAAGPASQGTRRSFGRHRSHGASAHQPCRVLAIACRTTQIIAVVSSPPWNVVPTRTRSRGGEGLPLDRGIQDSGIRRRSWPTVRSPEKSRFTVWRQRCTGQSIGTRWFKTSRRTPASSATLPTSSAAV